LLSVVPTGKREPEFCGAREQARAASREKIQKLAVGQNKTNGSVDLFTGIRLLVCPLPATPS
jgi:hypothetical protein